MRLLLKYQVWLLVLLPALSRIPQLMSPLMVLDGDECIVGLMAKHFYEGKGLPLYFYGQSFGFSFAEVIAIYPFYLLLGISDISVKVGMLSLWILGLVFFHKTLKNLSPKNSWTPFLFCLILILSPSWAIWSMKARGGYLTAFFLSSLTLYIITSKSANKSLCLFVAILCVLIYESQPLWLAGLFPFLVFYFYINRSMRSLLLFIAGLLVSSVSFFFIKRNLSSFWSPHVFSFKEPILERILSIPKLVFVNMTGSYDYFGRIPMGFATNFWAGCFTILISLGLAISLFFMIRRKQFQILYVSSIAVLFTLGYMSFIRGYAPRYLLPLTGYSLIMLSEILKATKNNYVNALFFGVLILSGTVSIIQFKDHRSEIQDRSLLREATNYLISQHVHYVFARHPLLQWQIDFYSQEAVIARHVALADRYPEYITRVNEAYRSHKPYAVLDFFYHYKGFQETANKHSIANNIYVVHLNPTPEALKEYGFDLGE
jgi:hypothetical protein